MKLDVWDNEIEKKKQNERWKDSFKEIGEEVYAFFLYAGIDTAAVDHFVMLFGDMM